MTDQGSIAFQGVCKTAHLCVCLWQLSLHLNYKNVFVIQGSQVSLCIPWKPGIIEILGFRKLWATICFITWNITDHFWKLNEMAASGFNFELLDTTDEDLHYYHLAFSLFPSLSLFKGGSLEFSITYAKRTSNLPPLPNPLSTQRLFTLCVHVWIVIALETVWIWCGFKD